MFENLTIVELITVILSLSAFLTAVSNIKVWSKKAINKAIVEIADPMIEAKEVHITSQLQKTLDKLNSNMDQLIKNDTVQQDALMSITADTIHQAYLKYTETEAVIDSHTFDVLSHLYSSYKGLHGNGLVKQQMEVLTKLYTEGGTNK